MLHKLVDHIAGHIFVLVAFYLDVMPLFTFDFIKTKEKCDATLFQPLRFFQPSPLSQLSKILSAMTSERIALESQ